MNQNANKYSTLENILKIGDCKIPFEYRIDDIVEVFDMLIVVLEHLQGVIFNENVFGVSLTEKKIKWQIAKLKYGAEVNCPFVGAKLHNNRIHLNNWCDIYLIVDPLTGEILERSLPAKS